MKLFGDKWCLDKCVGQTENDLERIYDCDSLYSRTFTFLHHF